MPRQYNSTVRSASATVTRGRIVAAARQLFAEQGYGATSIQSIARAAGVAVPTVYATFGTKRAVLVAILDSADAETGTRQLASALRASAGHPQQQLRLVVNFCVRFHADHEDVIRLARAAAGSEPDLAELWQEGEGRRRAAQAPIVASWKPALADGLSVSEALDTLWAMTGPDTYETFVVGCGWGAARFERWLLATLERLLFEPAQATRHPRKTIRARRD